MGCAAGKTSASSPEVSTEVTKENGWQTVKDKTLEYVRNNSTGSPDSESCGSVHENNLNDDEYFSSATQNHDGNSEMYEHSIPTHQPKRKFTPGVDAPPRSVPLKHMNSMATRSQLEFFLMLDRKIAEGPDYSSEAES